MKRSLPSVVVVEVIHDGFADIQDREFCVDGPVECQLGLQKVDGDDRVEDFEGVEVRLGGILLDLFFVAE